MLQIDQKKETANIWEDTVGNIANIANFMHLWKTRLGEYNCGGIFILPSSNIKVLSFNEYP